MMQFAEVLSKVGSDDEPADPVRTVRVNTTGWDSWLKSDAAPAPSPGNLYLDDEISDEEPEAASPEAESSSFREEVLRSDYQGPGATGQEQAEAPARPEPLDLASELARHRLEVMSEAELRALRRRLARRVHPDLPDADTPGSEAMVRVNVAIDAALRERRPRSRPA
jgi:hypothetical protein